MAAALLPFRLGHTEDLVWFARQLAVCVLVSGGIGPHRGLLAAMSVDGGLAAVSSQWLHSRCPGSALGCRCCDQLLPELRAGAKLQLQTNSGQPHCSHRHWHPPQSHGVCAVTNPGRLSPMLGVPRLSTPCSSSRGDVFLLGYKGDISF